MIYWLSIPIPVPTLGMVAWWSIGYVATIMLGVINAILFSMRGFNAYSVLAEHGRGEMVYRWGADQPKQMRGHRMIGLWFVWPIVILMWTKALTFQIRLDWKADAQGLLDHFSSKRKAG